MNIIFLNMAKKFDRFTLEQHTQVLCDLFFGGKLSEARNINGSNLRKLFIGLAKEFQRIESTIATIAEEYDIQQTTLLIEEWESAIGIPDDCFPIANTIEERRNNVLAKLRAAGTVTENDFISLAALIGFTVTITPLQDIAFPVYPVPFYPTKAPASRFVWIVSGANVIPEVPPYNVPFTPAGGAQSILVCLFNLLKPAFTRIIFQNN